MAGSPSDLRINLLWPSSCKNSTTESVACLSPPLPGSATAPVLRVLLSSSAKESKVEVDYRQLLFWVSHSSVLLSNPSATDTLRTPPSV
eukprot:2644993-Amphidinium_carterae.1